MSPSRRFDPAVPHCHNVRNPGAHCRLDCHLDRRREECPVVRPSALVAHRSHVHPPARISQLARNPRLARLPVPRPRRDADRRQHLGRRRAEVVPARACRGDAPRAAHRLLPDLARERPPVRRRRVAQLLRSLRIGLASTGRGGGGAASGPLPRRPPARGRAPLPPPATRSRARASTRARTAAAAA